MSCVLGLYLMLLWGREPVSAEKYCMDQPMRAETSIGGSITFPCSLVHPEREENITSVSIAVRAANEYFCGNENNEIYNDSSNLPHNQDSEPLSVKWDPKPRKASVTISNLQSGKRYCCRVQIKLQGGSSAQWQSPGGTEITVRGENEMILEHHHFIPALSGDTVTVISRFKTNNINIIPNVTTCRVGKMDGMGCNRNNYAINCTQRESIFIFQISPVDGTHSGSYCYSIDYSTGDGSFPTYTGIGTELLILNPYKTLNISQPPEVVFKKSIIINCSFSVQDSEDILWIGVYWMTGNPREHFVYHPDPDYIHPDYKGKTRLVGDSDLLLEDFHGSDNTTLYCRVAIRRCLDTTDNYNPNKIGTVLEEGPGTRLRVPDNSNQQENLQILLFSLYVICIIFILLVILVICRKKRKDPAGCPASIAPPTGNTSLPEPSCRPSDLSAQTPRLEQDIRGSEYSEVIETQEKGEHLVYATVSHQPPSPAAKPKTRPYPGPETIYAVVKKY